MKKAFATVLGVLVATMSLAGIARAQNWIQVRGTLQAVDCRAMTVTLYAPDGAHVFPLAPNAVAFVNAAPIGVCTLRRYVGSVATVSIAAAGSELVVGRVDVSVAATPPPPPYPYYYPYYGPPFWFGIGIVFGPGFHHGFHHRGVGIGPGFHHGGGRD